MNLLKFYSLFSLISPVMERLSMLKSITPYRDSKLSKKDQVTRMFDHIAFRYDLMNHLLSMGIDRRWRKKAVSILQDSSPHSLLDVATGTGDLAIAAWKGLHCERIVGIDLSEEMLVIGRKKIKDAGLEASISLEQGDGETISFPDHTFDAVTVGFGLRNFEDLDRGLQEIRRVLIPGGRLVVLEFSHVGFFPVKQLFNFYFQHIAPSIGKWVSKDRVAYDYLPESVKAFPQGPEMVQILNSSGFHSVSCKKMSLGICSIYQALK
jgi:demethylmenaquinone methyltransferase/2-methoxy-6-polyprenyl-1,4-benzoquinol methylase